MFRYSEKHFRPKSAEGQWPLLWLLHAPHDHDFLENPSQVAVSLRFVRGQVCYYAGYNKQGLCQNELLDNAVYVRRPLV